MYVHSSVGLPSGSLITIGGWTPTEGRLAEVWLLKKNFWSQLMSLNQVRFIKNYLSAKNARVGLFKKNATRLN